MKYKETSLMKVNCSMKSFMVKVDESLNKYTIFENLTIQTLKSGYNYITVLPTLGQPLGKPVGPPLVQTRGAAPGRKS